MAVPVCLFRRLARLVAFCAVVRPWYDLTRADGGGSNAGMDSGPPGCGGPSAAHSPRAPAASATRRRWGRAPWPAVDGPGRQPVGPELEARDA
jgi:hypothetical protein